MLSFIASTASAKDYGVLGVKCRHLLTVRWSVMAARIITGTVFQLTCRDPRDENT